MTYTQGADVYLGDVSSQIAEFMVRPRPCLFINSHGAKWQGNPDYLFWELGPVIDSVDGLGHALRDAVNGHAAWRERQRDYFRRHLRCRTGCHRSFGCSGCSGDRGVPRAAALTNTPRRR
jgi:hypothetical protein